MAKKVKDIEYAYVSIMLQARESRMLTRGKMESMIAAPSFEDCAGLLLEYGYDDMSEMGHKEIDAALSQRRTAFYRELSAILPQIEVLWLFQVKYDYSNAKTLIKTEGVGLPPDLMFSDSGRIPADMLADALYDDNYSELPEILGSAMAESKIVLARTSNPQLADIVLDKAQYGEMAELVESLSNEFARGYYELSVDIANLRMAVRAKLMRHNADFIKHAMIYGGSVSFEALYDAVAAGRSAMLFTAAPLAQAADVADGTLSSMSEFERQCDNAVTRYMASARFAGYGHETVLSHIASVETEIAAVRMILSGKLHSVSPELIRKRLRESNV